MRPGCLRGPAPVAGAGRTVLAFAAMATVPELDWAKSTRGVPGWARPVSIGCAVLVFIMFAVLFGGLVSSDKVLDWGLNRLYAKVLRVLPPDTPPATRSRLTRTFHCVITAVRDGRLDQRALGALSRACTDALADQRLTPEEIARIQMISAQLCVESGGQVEP